MSHCMRNSICTTWVAMGLAVVVTGYTLIMKRRDKNESRKSLPTGLRNRLRGQGEQGNVIEMRMEAAIQLAFLAGINIKHAMRVRGKEIFQKDNAFDLVTATDKANESLILSELQRLFPSDSFIGEETSADMGAIPSLGKEVTWIVDPIDGTTNFIHGLPIECVSIGLCINGEAVGCVVYSPMSDELFLAAKGCGAWVNGVETRCSEEEDMSCSLVIIEHGTVKTPKEVDRMFASARNIFLHCRAVRQFGSGVMDFIFVGRGQCDAVFSGVAGEGWKPWDYCAGSVFVQEAGCTLLSVDGGKFDLFGKSVCCASSSALANNLVKYGYTSIM